jgi:protein-S-isoprenylcysteine O-methyltransferase Ste14
MTPFYWRSAVILIILVAAAVRASYDLRQSPSTLRNSIDNIVEEAGRIAFLLVVLQLLGVEVLPMQLIYPDDVIVRGIGIVLVSIGSCLFLWSRAVRSKTWGGMRQDPFGINGHFLCTRGPYQFVRHPAYAGFLVIAVGVEMALASWMFLIVVFPLVAVGARAALKEERDLHALYDARFDDYERSTRWRLVPGIF